MALWVPDRHGKPKDVVLGFDDPSDYKVNTAYLGAIVGRYANRIAAGSFCLSEKPYRLAVNNGPNHLHGGNKGFDQKLWDVLDHSKTRVVMSCYSPHGEEGYPGNLEIQVTYSIDDENTLAIDYQAITDATTHINLTNHSYFNLAGHDAGSVLDHVLELNADHFTPIDQHSIPTGEIRPVANTPFDFKTPQSLGKRINSNNEQLALASGYDHNFVINEYDGTLTLAATVEEPSSGTTMTVYTTEPGFQLYTGNFLDGLSGKCGAIYAPRSALCIETQHFPDSPNEPDFPSTVLEAGETFRSRTEYRFGVG